MNKFLNNRQIFYPFSLIVFLLGFWGLKILHYPFLDYIYLSVIVVMSLPYIQYIRRKGFYDNMIILYSAFVMLSCLYSWQFNGQSLFLVIGHSYIYFALLFFFYLRKENMSFKDIEKLMEMLSLCFCLCYLLQWLVYPIILFSSVEQFSGIGRYRARMDGSLCCYFLLTYSINQYLLKHDKKYILYGILSFIPIILQGFRSLVVLTLVSIFMMIPLVLRSGWKTITYSVVVAVSVLLVSTTSLVQSKIDEMLRRQNNEQTFENQDYIRFRSFDYYWNYQFTKPYEKIIGGGQPVDKKSSYKRSIDNAIKYSHFYWVDLGIVGLSMIIGIPAVLILVVLYLWCMWKCKEPPTQYIRFTLLILLVGSIFTTMELYRDGNILLLSLLLYLEYKYHREKLSIAQFKLSE